MMFQGQARFQAHLYGFQGQARLKVEPKSIIFFKMALTEAKQPYPMSPFDLHGSTFCYKVSSWSLFLVFSFL